MGSTKISLFLYSERIEGSFILYIFHDVYSPSSTSWSNSSSFLSGCKVQLYYCTVSPVFLMHHMLACLLVLVEIGYSMLRWRRNLWKEQQESLLYETEDKKRVSRNCTVRIIIVVQTDARIILYLFMVIIHVPMPLDLPLETPHHDTWHHYYFRFFYAIL